MKVYAVFDTNVLVSAMITHNPDSPTVRVIEMVAKGLITPLFNGEIITEYDEVLHREKFNLREDDILNMMELILDNGLVTSRIATMEEFQDPNDVVFFEVAMSKEGTYLVTGNTKHFPKNPIVVTPAEMVRIIEGR